MKHVIYLFDSKNINIDSLVRSEYFTSEDLNSFDMYTSPISKAEHILSLYLKKKYYPDYYLNEKGKPLSDESFFNISHSDGVLVFVRESNLPIGIDIELIREIKDSLIRKLCRPEEYQNINSNEDFFRMWTMKESLLKTIGTGINMRLEEIPFTEGTFTFNNKKYTNKILKHGDYIITVTIEGNELDTEIICFNNLH